jgi:hypothetical protein
MRRVAHPRGVLHQSRKFADADTFPENNFLSTTKIGENVAGLPIDAN